MIRLSLFALYCSMAAMVYTSSTVDASDAVDVTATKFPTTRSKSPTPSPSDDSYEPGSWPTFQPYDWNWPSPSPITATPTTGYPTSTPTRIKSDFHKWSLTGITYQEYASIKPDGILNVTVSIYEKTLPKQYINMPAFDVMNQDTLSKDGWDVATAKLVPLSYDSVNKIRTYATLTGIKAPGSIGLHQLRWNNGLVESETFTIEVTCSDGIMCNGDERYVYYKDPSTKVLKAKCMNALKPLCDDGNDCTDDTCDEATGRCKFVRDLTVPTKKCPLCNPEGCVKKCGKRTCGPDSCGGSCGPECTKTNEYCDAGKCKNVGAAKGVCGNPYDLTADFLAKRFKGIFDYQGDTNKGFSVLRPYCNFGSEAKEIIYMFKVPSDIGYVGLDARSAPLSDKGMFYSTTMQLIEVDPFHFPNPTAACNAVNIRPDLSVACNQYSTPPGDGGSRVTWALKPGFTYYLQVEGGWESAGKYNLTVALTPGCTMKCTDKVCGDSGCGKDFPCQLNKPIPPGSVCDNARLLAKPCKPNCKGKECGDDGCGGSCGKCDFSKGDICSSTTGKCVPLGKCDHFKPKCTFQDKVNGAEVTVDGCPENHFCGVDCTCFEMNKNVDLPDLYINDAMMSEVEIQDDYEVKPGDCAYDEGCFTSTGVKRILRFPTLVANQGRKDFAAASPPESRPDIYVWGACHGHWHFDGFAVFSLLSKDRKTVIVEGGKRSFCALDSMQMMQFPSAPCLPKHDCSKQGVSIGWTDIYGKGLDCQFIDITKVPPGDYVIKQCTNVKRTYEELSRANNCMYYPVTIPKQDPTRTKSPTFHIGPR